MNAFLTALDAHRESTIALSRNGARFIPGDDTLVVTFQPFTVSDDPEELATDAVWAENFLHKRGFSVLGVNRQSNNWYRASDLHALLRALQQRGFFSRFRRVMFYGGSMGGFAALAFAELAPGCTVLAHNPQTTMRPSETPWETRFELARQQSWEGEFSDGEVGARAAARVYVSYDPFDIGDSRHVDRLAPDNLVRLRMPMVGHQMPIWLMQMKLLGAVFDAALDGSLSVSRFRSMARARFELPHYLLNLAARTRNTRLQQYLGEKARGLAPQKPGPREYLWQWARRRQATRAPTAEPVLIWTVAGCRGDEVMAWLRALRPDAHAALEPFSGRHTPNDLALLLRKPGHVAMARDEVQRILTGSQVILHRISASPTRLGSTLLDEARALAFTHVLLHRREVAPSPAPDAATAALDDSEVRRRVALARQSLTALAGLQAEIQARGDPFIRLPLEAFDPAGTRAEDQAALCALLRLLGVAPTIPRPVLPSEGPTAPGHPALTEALAWLPTLEEGEAFLRAEATWPGQPAHAAVDALPPVLRLGESVRFSGLAVTPPDASGFDELRVEQCGVRHDAKWRQASPGGTAVFPTHPDATRARFGPVTLRADPTAPVRLLLCQPQRATPLELAHLAFVPLNRTRIVGLFMRPWGMAFRPIPGVASAALGHALHGLMNAELGLPGPAWTSDAARQRDDLERCSDISGARFKFAVLRDPVERFTTLLRRWVVAPRWQGPDLPVAPGLSEFIEHFDGYLRDPALQAAFLSQATLLAEPDAFDVLYRLQDLPTLQRDMLNRTGRELVLRPRTARPLWQRLGFGSSKWPADSVRWIRQRYADDCALWEALER